MPRSPILDPPPPSSSPALIFGLALRNWKPPFPRNIFLRCRNFLLMAILVVCQSCHSRFEVRDQFAGRTGECPKCKAGIKIPDKSQEVKVHAPENYGPADSTGRATLKPISREKIELSPVVAGGIAGAVLFVFVMAFFMRFDAFQTEGKLTTVGLAITAIGLALIAPALSYAGYWFLRDRDLGGYGGRSLWIRLGICASVYGGMWAVYALLSEPLGGVAEGPWIWMFVAPPFLIVGTVTAFATLDLDFGRAFFHCCLFCVVTILLRLAMGLAMIEGVPAISPLDM